MEAADSLSDQGIAARVVSMPSWELFGAQDAAYRAEVLGAGVPRLAVEAAATLGWERWVGNDPKAGAVIGLDHFGASAPFEVLYEKFGLTSANVTAKALDLLGRA